MEELWQRIENWLKAKAPHIQEDLALGANTIDFDQAEQQLNIKFPADFREAYQIHNGQAGNAMPVMGSWELYPIVLIVSEWEDEKELFDRGGFKEADEVVRPQGPVRKQWWHPKWIPIAGNSSGDYYCLDLVPTEGGHEGQIIVFWHADEEREVIADSFRSLLSEFANKLEAGEYKVNDRGRIINSRNV